MRGFLLMVAFGSAACGRLGFDGEGGGTADEEGGNMAVGVVEANVRAPAVCERLVRLATTSCPDADLAVATTPAGATVVWVPASGGDLQGVDIGKDRVAGAVTTIHSGAFTASGAAFIDGQLVAAGISTSRAIVHAAPQPLAAGAEIGNFDGEFVGKTAMTHSGGDRTTATSCSAGLTMNAFDASWNGSADTFSVSTAQTTNIDSAQLASTTFAVWSTATECHYETITNKTTGTARQTNNRTCANARVTATDDEVGLVFERNGQVGMVIDAASTVSVANAVMIPNARAPRVQWDGVRYWVSWLTDDNHVAVGYLDSYGMLMTAKLADAAPSDRAYELGMLDGQPWLFAVDANEQLSATRMCVPAP